MITKSLLTKIIKKGNLTWVRPNGEINTYGDGSGEPIKIRTKKSFSEKKLILFKKLFNEATCLLAAAVSWAACVFNLDQK